MFMLSSKIFKTAVAGVVALGLGVGLAYAGADDMIKARQDQMKANGKAIGELVKIMKGDAPYDAAAVKAQIDAMKAAADTAMAANAWSPDSQNGATVETWTKDEAFTDAAGFKAAYMDLVKAEDAVAATTDEAGFKAAFMTMGGACKACHEKYRRAKD
jgi:cytochrome c556